MNFKHATILAVGFNILISCHDVESDDATEHERDNLIIRQDDKNECGVEDGQHSATIDYYNPNTGYSATYTLNVEVENCQVIQIDFNNGGYLDGDHIDPTDIDEDGNASVEDDRG